MLVAGMPEKNPEASRMGAENAFDQKVFPHLGSFPRPLANFPLSAQDTVDKLRFQGTE